MSHLTGKTVAFLVTDGFEDSELTSPWEAVTSHGAQARLVSPAGDSVTGKNGHQQSVDIDSSVADAAEFGVDVTRRAPRSAACRSRSRSTCTPAS